MRTSDRDWNYESSCLLGPIELVILQGTPFCNLNCSYCYLSESSRKEKTTLSLSSIKTVFSKILQSRYTGTKLDISWHSGEPLVLQPSYYEEAIDIITELALKHCGPEFSLQFDIQTNGTLINQKWCDFFKKFEDILSVGISCDGPASYHDNYRRDWAGNATHWKTQKGMDLMQSNGIKFDALAVVSPDMLDKPDEFYEFFNAYAKDIREFHFNLLDECVFPADDVESSYVYGKKYYRFLKSLLRRINCANNLPNSLEIRNFSAFYDRALTNDNDQHNAWNMSRPFKSLTIEVNGDLSTFYAGVTIDECKDLYGDGQGLLIGNLLKQDIEEIAASEKIVKIADDFAVSHRACEQSCEYFSLCYGGYNLIKQKRYSTFDATETPECYIHVKTFVNALLDDLNEHASKPNAHQPLGLPTRLTTSISST